MRRSLLIHLAVYGFYLLVTVIVTYPLITQISTAVVGFVYGDGYEMAHHIWWFKHALQTGQPLFTQTMLAYPNGIEGVTLWADPLQFFPAWLLAFVLPLIAAANVTILITLAANGWAMFGLVRYLIMRPHPGSPTEGELPLPDFREGRKTKDSTFNEGGRVENGQTRGSAPTEEATEAGSEGEERARHVVPLRDAEAEGGQTHRSAPTEEATGSEVRARQAAPLRDVGGIGAALLAGLVFMLYPTMQGHLGAGHAGLLVQWPVPLYVYSLFRLRAARGMEGNRAGGDLLLPERGRTLAATDLRADAADAGLRAVADRAA